MHTCVIAHGNIPTFDRCYACKNNALVTMLPGTNARELPAPNRSRTGDLAKSCSDSCMPARQYQGRLANEPANGLLRQTAYQSFSIFYCDDASIKCKIMNNFCDSPY